MPANDCGRLLVAVRDLRAFFRRANDNVPPGRSAQAANAEAVRLLDAVFRELKLVDASPITRLVWRGCAWRFRHNPGPRITSAFRR